MKLAREVIFFGIGGGIAFLIDAGVVQLLVRQLGWDPYLARIPSFLLAASVTWWWNRHLSFAHRRHLPVHHEWLRWMAVMVVGAAVNYGMYALAVALFPLVRAWPLLGVAAGSLAAAGFNFTGARKVVFNRPE